MKTLLMIIVLLFVFSTVYAADMLVGVDYSDDWYLEIWQGGEEPEWTHYGTGYEEIDISYEKYINDITVAFWKVNQDDEVIYLYIKYQSDNGPERIIGVRTNGDTVSLGMIEEEIKADKGSASNESYRISKNQQ